MGGNGADPTSYWFDACDDACDDVNALSCIDFASGTELDPSSLPNFDRVADEGFVAEIDRILESINSEPNTLHHEKKEEPKVQPMEQTYEQPKPMDVDVNNVARTREVKRQRSSFNGDYRDGKRPRDGWGGERGRGGFRRGHCHRGSPRGTFDRRWGRRRERDGTGTDSRDSRGYWERDKSGKMMYHNGSWESETEREAKRVKKDGTGENVSGPDIKMEEVGRKEKIIVEEHARQYQLEVLEHAKKRNTIAFLETGAGKTLIAVLLMKSVCTEMMRKNKKMLAVFLVPKVPLVYQV